MDGVAYFQALYTTQLTQKRKKWHDGRCVFNYAARRKKLLDEDGRVLAEELWRPDRSGEPEAGAQLTFERFLVELDSLVRVKVVRDEPAPPPRRPGPSGIGAPEPVVEVVPRAKPSPRRPVVLPDMGPPLTEVLPAIGRMRPLSVEPELKRRKYQPWADPATELGPDQVTASNWPPQPAQKEVPQREEPSWAAPTPDARGFGGHEETPNWDGAASADATWAAVKIEDDGPLADASEDDPMENGSVGQAEPVRQAEPVTADVAGVDDAIDDAALQAPDTYELDSDLESDVDIVDAGPASQRRSLFEDVPADPPQEVPWTKEAYLLFSWHPPVVKSEPV